MKSAICVSAILLALLCFIGFPSDLIAYQSPEQVNAAVEKLAGDNKDRSRLHNIGKTPSSRDILLLEIGGIKNDLPAIFVIANMEGNSPIATEAAFRLADLLLSDWADDIDACKWYILPTGNPDGYAHFFKNPLHRCSRNDKPFNDDNDDATDEDGPEDLNGDGYITMMRQVHPEGGWMDIEGNPVLMKSAEAGKGDDGKYRLFTEGIDNDGDGQINEDGPGGVNPGHNFPHDFQHYTRSDGLWSASESESRAVLQFAFDHPEIAMVLVFGRSNSLKNVPESSRKAEAAKDRYKLPEWVAEQAGLDPDDEYPISMLVDMAKEFTGMDDITEDMVLQFLGVGAAVNPDRQDLPYWSEISERYTKFIKEAELDGDRLDPAGFPKGSVEEWAYYQYGVPTFSMDFWTVPVVKKEQEKKEGVIGPDELEKMTNEEFIALGEEGISKFLKDNDAPAQYTASMIIMGLQSGMMTTKKMAEMMRKMKEMEEAGGADETEQALYDFDPAMFVLWEPYEHPTLGSVEIGGKIPYAELAPPMDSVEQLLAKQLPFVRELAKLLPQTVIEKVEIKETASNIWRVEAWIANNGFLPYPTHQGNRCKRPTPVIAKISGKPLNIIEGKERQAIGLLAGSGGVNKVGWLLQASPGTSITIEVETRSAGSATRTVTLTGGGE